MVGHDVLLLCELHSNLAVPCWTLNGEQLQGYAVEFGYRVGTDGLLVIGAQTGQSGHYRCYAVENGVWIPVCSYMVKVQPVPSYLSNLSRYPTALPENFFTTTVLLINPTSPSGLNEQPLHSLPSSPDSPTNQQHMEAVYIILVAVFGGLCLVLTVVLLYVSFCTHSAHGGGKYSQDEFSVTPVSERKRSSHVELKTISGHCNGRTDVHYMTGSTEVQLMQIIPGIDQVNPNVQPPPAPPLPNPPPVPSADYANGLSTALPSVLRKMNGNSYMLLTQTDTDMTSPLYHSFTEELSRILEKRKHTQLHVGPDESSV